MTEPALVDDWFRPALRQFDYPGLDTINLRAASQWRFPGQRGALELDQDVQQIRNWRRGLDGLAHVHQHTVVRRTSLHHVKDDDFEFNLNGLTVK